MKTELETVQEYLAGLPAGKVENPAHVVTLLAPVWDQLEGGTETEMAGFKLHNRTEGMHWEPPLLTFEIVRHGAAVLGSIYAEIQIWTVDLQKKTATVTDTNRRRVIGERQSPVNVEPIADEIADAIRNGREDPRLKWYSESKVQVRIGKVLLAKSAVRQTLDGRRARLREAIRKRLQPLSWREVRANVYQHE